jgi:hypothetical protein
MSSNLKIILTALEEERTFAEQEAAKFASAIAALQNGNGHKPTNGNGHGNGTLSATDVAKRLGVSVTRIYQLAPRLGGKRAANITGRPLQFDSEKVEKFAESRNA